MEKRKKQTYEETQRKKEGTATERKEERQREKGRKEERDRECVEGGASVVPYHRGAWGSRLWAVATTAIGATPLERREHDRRSLSHRGQHP